MRHLSESELSALLDEALDAGARAAAERHLAACAECRAALADLEAQDRTLARALERDPGDAYFETFAARVQKRIWSGEGRMEQAAPGLAEVARYRAGGPAPASVFEALGRWLSGPRLAWTGAAAAVVVGAGVVLLVSHETPVQTLRDTGLAARSEQVARGAPSPSASAPERGQAAPPSEARGGTPLAAREPHPEAEPSQSRPGRFAGPPAAAPPAAGPPAAVPPAAGPPAAALTPSRSVRAENALPESRMREVRRQGGEETPVPGTAQTLVPESSPAPVTGPAPLTVRGKRVKPLPAPLAGAPARQQETAAPGAESAAPSRADMAQPQAKAAGPGTLERESAGAVRVCGAVHDPSGRAISGAQIAIAELGLTTTADASGRWCLDVPPGDRTLTVMAVGFRAGRRPLAVASGTPEQDVVLAAVPVLGEASAGAGFAVTSRAAWPASVEPLAWAAERASGEAASRHTAGAYDSAATHWAQVAALVGQDPVSVTARRFLADARYRAWQLDKTKARALAAISALNSYLKVAPTPEQRRITQARLKALRRP